MLRWHWPTLAAIVALIMLAGAGCRLSQPADEAIAKPPAVVSFGPLQYEVPAELAERVLTLVSGLPDRGAVECDDTVLWTVVAFPPGSPVSTVRTRGGLLVVDGRQRGSRGYEQPVDRLLFPVLFSPASIAELLRLSPQLRIVAHDLPGRSVVVSAADTDRVARAFAESVWVEGDDWLHWSHPYPQYRLEFSLSGQPASLVWHGSGMRVLIADHRFPQGTYADTEGKLLAVVRDLLPVLGPAELEGRGQLLGSARVRAIWDGGDLTCEDGPRVLAVARLLLGCEPGGTLPSDQQPALVTFSGPFGERTVRLYAEGYEFNGVYYQGPYLQRRVMRALHD
ncbi:MAG: hypothetical protein AB1492_00850 [Bacillota bacterium]